MKKVTITIAIIMGIVIATCSIKCNAVVYAYKKLSRPLLRHPEEIETNKGRECLYCSPKKHYLEIKTKMSKDKRKVKFKVYRKKAGTKKYKKIKYKKIGFVSSDFDSDNYTRYVIMDYTAKAGETYYYKAKAYRKQGKKTIYSPMSKKFKMRMCNDTGFYEVTSVTEASTGISDVVIKVKSKKSNDKTYFWLNESWEYFASNQGKRCKIESYSFDNKEWYKKKKFVLKSGKTCYLKFHFEDGPVEYIGATDKESLFTTSYGMYYCGHYKNGISYLSASFNLIKQKGTVEIDATDDM